MWHIMFKEKTKHAMTIKASTAHSIFNWWSSLMTQLILKSSLFTISQICHWSTSRLRISIAFLIPKWMSLYINKEDLLKLHLYWNTPMRQSIGDKLVTKDNGLGVNLRQCEWAGLLEWNGRWRRLVSLFYTNHYPKHAPTSSRDTPTRYLLCWWRSAHVGSSQSHQ